MKWWSCDFVIKLSLLGGQMRTYVVGNYVHYTAVPRYLISCHDAGIRISNIATLDSTATSKIEVPDRNLSKIAYRTTPHDAFSTSFGGSTDIATTSSYIVLSTRIHPPQPPYLLQRHPLQHKLLPHRSHRIFLFSRPSSMFPTPFFHAIDPLCLLLRRTHPMAIPHLVFM